jgi:hypothetical protein
MAIGSAPEIGIEFTTWGKMSEEARIAWFDHIRTHWTENLMAGYATLHTAPRGVDNPYAHV